MQRYARWGPNGSKGPELLVREVLLHGLTEPVDFNDPSKGEKPAEPDVWQCEYLQAYGEGEKRIASRSGNGVGKTACLSWCIVHHFISEYPQITAVTAPTQGQMFDALYPEVLTWFQKLPEWVQGSFVVKSESIEHSKFPNKSFVSFATARAEKPEALAGKHSEQGSVLLVADEAQAIHEAVYLNATGSMSGRKTQMMLAGNPTYTSGLFYDAHTKLARQDVKTPGDWLSIHVNAETCRRVTEDFKQEKARRFGPDSNAYRIFVLGEFPTGADNTVIPMQDILAAQERDIQPTHGTPFVWGLDVARFGSDRSALVKRKGTVVPEVPKWWRGKDTMELSVLIREEYNATNISDRPVRIFVDVIGIGAGVVDRLREMGLPAIGINVGEAAALDDRYANLKAELWFKMKEFFARKDCKIPKDDLSPGGLALGQELATPTYDFVKPSNRLRVEGKQEIRNRGLPSPDLAEALMLTFAGPATQAMFGTNIQFSEPLRRNLAGVV